MTVEVLLFAGNLLIVWAGWTIKSELRHIHEKIQQAQEPSRSKSSRRATAAKFTNNRYKGRATARFFTPVDARLYANVSASMHAPLAKANPAPGAWYLKHVGLLGAMPPAVKGLGRVSFAEGLDSREWLIGPAEFADAGLLAGMPSAFPVLGQAPVEFACPDGLSADADRLRIHYAALHYQHAHGVGYLEAVRTVSAYKDKTRNAGSLRVIVLLLWPPLPVACTAAIKAINWCVF